MLDPKTVCQKIRNMYPDIGRCGIELSVDFDRREQTWVVRLAKDGHALKTFLEPGEAEACLDADRCVGVGIDIAQLRGNIERLKGLER